MKKIRAMGKLTTALMFGTYVTIGLIVAALLWNGGSDWAASMGAMLGTLALCVSGHVMVARGHGEGKLRKEISNVREAQRLMTDALESTQFAINDLSERIAFNAQKRSEELSDEVRMIETLVKRMGEDLEHKLSAWKAAPVSLHGSRRDRQAVALIETVREALIENRVDLYLQPVVSLPQRKTIFYESFSRLRDDTGRIIMPAEYLAVAEPEGLVPAIDNLLLFRCVQIVRRLAKQDRKIGIFCNISLTSLGDETFFPQFLAFLSENRDLSGALIFELGQDAFGQRGAVEARNMAKLADLGFRFSIDKVNTLDFDLQDFQRADVKFCKVGAPLLLEQLLDGNGPTGLKAMRDIHAGDFAALLARYGIELIAEKVENERQVVDVLDLEVAYAQGHLFGEPRAIKEQVLAETDPPADFLRTALTLKRRRVA